MCMCLCVCVCTEREKDAFELVPTGSSFSYTCDPRFEIGISTTFKNTERNTVWLEPGEKGAETH